MNPTSKAFRSGQFARLCRTTKDTLRHYEDIGLLTPAFTAENGYKNYLPDQVMDFMLISSLRDAGCSLADVKRFLEGDKGKLREVMAERVGALDRQIAVLERKRDLLASSVERIDELETWRDEAGRLVSGSWRIRKRPEAHYIETRLPLDSGIEAAFGAIADHAAYCEEKGLGLLAESQQASYRIVRSCFAAGGYQLGFFLCTQTLRPVACDRHRVRPAGRCLQYLGALPLDAARDDGPLEENLVFEMYGKIALLMEREGIVPTGDAYTAELSLGTIEGSDFLWAETNVMVAQSPQPQRLGSKEGAMDGKSGDQLRA